MFAPTGCYLESYAPVAPRVTVEEINVYATWLRNYHEEHPKRLLTVFPFTLPLPPVSVEGTTGQDEIEGLRKEFRHEDVNTSGFDELIKLGGASYPLTHRFDAQLANFAPPCFGDVCTLQEEHPAPVETAEISFSRVAFSRSGRFGFLHVGSMLTQGHAHYGGRFVYLLVEKKGTSWTFRNVGPTPIS